MSLLDDAAAAVSGPRRDSYGPPGENHARTAALWSAYLHAAGRTDLTAEDVCWLNVLQKISRDLHSPSRDTLVDVIGYVLNVAELRGT